MAPRGPHGGPLRVAVLAPIAWRVPPRRYGPWEQIASLLTEGLVAAGCEVTLFATLDSRTRARLDGVCPRPYEEDRELDAKVWEALHIAHLFEQAERFDLIHNHFDFLPLAFSGLVATPVVTTVHGFSSPRILPAYRRWAERGHLVAISDADRAPGLRYAATIHHGIDLSAFTPQAEAEPGHLLVLGRVHPDKGVAVAIDVARRAGLPVVIAGIVQDRAYHEREVVPRLGPDARYVGPVGPRERDRLLGGARALLHLIDFEEPFGLAMVEAMACGTPVLATRRGSVPEVVEDGLTGVVVDRPEDAVTGLERLARLDRRAVRRRAEERFSAARMVRDYLALYERILHHDDVRDPLVPARTA